MMNYAEEMDTFWKLEFEEFEIADILPKFRLASNEDLIRLRTNHVSIMRDSTLKQILPKDLYADYISFVSNFRSRNRLYTGLIKLKLSERVMLANVLARASYHLGLHMDIYKSRRQEKEEEGRLIPDPTRMPNPEEFGLFTQQFTNAELRFLNSDEPPMQIRSGSMTGRIRSDRPTMEPISPYSETTHEGETTIARHRRVNSENFRQQSLAAETVEQVYLPSYAMEDAELTWGAFARASGLTHNDRDPIRAEESPAERVIRHNRERGEQRMGFDTPPTATRHRNSQSSPTRR